MITKWPTLGYVLLMLLFRLRVRKMPAGHRRPRRGRLLSLRPRQGRTARPQPRIKAALCAWLQMEPRVYSVPPPGLTLRHQKQVGLIPLMILNNLFIINYIDILCSLEDI